MNTASISHHSGSEWPASTFEVIPPSRTARPLVAHVPHASTIIPSEVRAELLIDDRELADELHRLTDWYTDDLFAWLTDQGATRFINSLSRLVLDPERFLDDAEEPAAAVGQGVVYVRGSRGQPLRRPDAELRSRRIRDLYLPYHAALDEVVARTLEEHGSCTLLDCHSFPSRPLPSEVDQSTDRPDVCIGTDPFHTPTDLATSVERAFVGEGFRVKRDTPFSGAFVPSGSYGRDRRIRALMIEVRRDLYMDETTTERRPDYEIVKAAIERAIMRGLVK